MPQRGDQSPSFRQRRVDGIAVGQRGVKLGDQVNRHLIGHRRLHRQHRRNPLLHQSLRDAGIKMVARRIPPIAGIEHNQAQRAFVMQQLAQHLTVNGMAVSIVVLQDQTPLMRLGVKFAMTKEIKHVNLVTAQMMQQRAHRRPGQPLHNHAPTCNQLGQRLGDGSDLGIELQRRTILGTGGDNQNVERPADRQRRLWLRQVQITDKWGLGRLAQETPGVGIIEEFPGAGRQLGRVIGQPQANAQTGSIARYRVEAALPDRQDRTVKNSLEKPRADLLRLLSILRPMQRQD